MSQVKTAVSIDSVIFKDAESLAKKAHISRSHLFELAVKDWVKKEKDKDITARINRALEKIKITPEEKDHAERMRSHFRKIVQGEW